MAILRWLGLTFARFVGVSVMILGAWVVVGNLVESNYPAATMTIIAIFGVTGAAGGLAYLFSFDGPAPFRARWVRISGWVGMLFSVLLPSSLTPMLVPLVLLLIPTLFAEPTPAPSTEPPITSE